MIASDTHLAEGLRVARCRARHLALQDAMLRRVKNKFGNHFGPESHLTGGPESVHHQIAEHSVGKTIARVYLGDAEPEKSPVPERYPPDGMFRGEYLALEFTDGTAMMLEVAGSNSFSVHGDHMAKKQLASYRRDLKPD